MIEQVLRHSTRFIGLIGIAACIGCTPDDGRGVLKEWVEETWEDFSKGTLGEAGNNLYVSRDGQVQTIRRYDLNGSGFLDLVFNNTHDWHHDLPVTVGLYHGQERFSQEFLHVLGSQVIRSADLNRSGFQDLVFLSNRKNIQHERQRLSIVYGGADGWPDHRIQGNLPVHGGQQLELADLDANGWPDLVVLNAEGWLPAHPSGQKILRIYWGGPDGYHLSMLTDLPVAQATRLAAGDFSGNGHRDLAVLMDEDELRIYWAGETAIPEHTTIALPNRGAQVLTSAAQHGSGDHLWVGTSRNQIFQGVWANGSATPEWEVHPAYPATHLFMADIDGDGQLDAVLTQLDLHGAAGGEAAGARSDPPSPLLILWGHQNGFDPETFTELEAPSAIAAFPGDLTQNGLLDLGVAIHQTESVMAAESLLFIQERPRQFNSHPQRFDTKGAADVIIAQPSSELQPQVLFANSLGGTLLGKVPVYVYWGGADGFHPERRLEMPFRSAYSTTTADLDGSGYVDMVLLNSSYANQKMVDADPLLGAHIYWGGPDGQGGGPHGFTPQRRTIFQEPNLGSCNVADLNRDGYLDLIFGSYETAGQAHTNLVVYYGGPDGYTRDNRFALAVDGRSIGCHVADFSGNGWLDIVVASYNTNQVQIFYGGPDGFSEEKRTSIPMPSPIEVEVADLNGNGWLDLVVGCYNDPVSGHHDMGLHILWGGPGGFHGTRSQSLPGYTPNGLVVGDFDDDGFPDILSLNYHAEISRESLPTAIFWGGPEGFNPQRRTTLIVHSAIDALAGDFNGNGRIDLAIAAHSTDSDHHTDSLVFFNDGNRFAQPEVQKLPTIGTHFMWNQDLGNIRDRSATESYTSSVFSWAEAGNELTFSLEAAMPTDTHLTLSARSSVSEDSLPQASWQTISPGTPLPLDSNDRHFQYRIVFHSPNGDRFPALNSVQATLK